MKRAGRVLVVDDDESMVRLITKMLEREGYGHIRGVSNPAEVVSAYLEFKPNVVVLDLIIPGVKGNELIQQLMQAETEGYAPILVLTGVDEPDQKVEALKAGARDYLVKPFLSYEFLARVRNMLEIHQLYLSAEQKRALLQKEVQAQAGQILLAHHDTLHRLGLACEFRDDDTGNHARRLGDYAAVVAAGLGLDEDECHLLRQATPMHDIGKVGIPDAILLKPGKLTPEEFQVIKTHTTIGANILSGSRAAVLQAAEEVALTHHEKWNGQGYPRRLSGTEIPLFGRIVAVRDVFDALLSERPYKRAWSVEDAVAELERSKGGHFDPQVVDAFMAVLPRLLEIRALLL